MKRTGSYRTRQKEAIFDYIISLSGTHVSAGQIVAHLAEQEHAVSRTTVYRYLEELTRSGRVCRYTNDGSAGACYQYVGGHTDCHDHLHLKCEECGELIHLGEDTLGELQEYLFNKHDFQVRALKTVLYGVCNQCQSHSAKSV